MIESPIVRICVSGFIAAIVALSMYRVNVDATYALGIGALLGTAADTILRPSEEIVKQDIDDRPGPVPA